MERIEHVSCQARIATRIIVVLVVVVVMVVADVAGVVGELVVWLHELKEVLLLLLLLLDDDMVDEWLIPMVDK